MKFRIVILFFLTTLAVTAQDNKSKGDILFFEYAYSAAIQQYYKEQLKTPLTNQQFLNLADSYLKTGKYKKASEIYVKIHRKDSTISNHNFNKMLQSLARTSGMDRVKAFLATKSSFLTTEILENANFNFELLESDSQSDNLDFQTFNVSGNSAQSDFSPSFYKNQLLFSSGREQNSKDIYLPSQESYLDVFVANIDRDGDVYNPNPFTGIPNSKFHQATPYYSQELDNIFYVLSNSEEGELIFDETGKNTLSVGVADEKGEFEFLLRDLSTSFYYPFYDAAMGKLYFAANFEDGYGGTDIYFVYTNEGQIMSAPINLGPRVNSPGNEIAPFLFENNLYFSSDIFFGLGGMDIYKTNLHADDVFSIPINLGIGINSTYDDFGFIIKDNGEDGLLGYFSSNREGGKGNDDIYGFIVDERPGLKTFAISGRVINLSSNKGVAKAQIRLLDAEGNTIKEVYANDEGDYRVEIPWQDQITIQSTKDRHSIFSVTYSNQELEKAQKNTFNMGVKFLDDLVEDKEDQTLIKLKKFYFGRGKIQVTQEIATELDKVVDAVSRFPQLQLRIESHTDSRGGGSTNFRLSQQRSDAIKNYLLKNGVSSNNILYSVGYGEDKILNNCKNGVYCLDMLHQQNERSLIVVLNYNLLY